MSEGYKELQRLLEKVYRERGFDFREYKESTLTRRLGRRLRARGAKTYTNYARVLDQDPTEYDKLFDDLTINVTSFFRDDMAFQALEEVVLPALIHASRITHHVLRIWSAGCATGEEPYSIAMLMLEHLSEDIGPVGRYHPGPPTLTPKPWHVPENGVFGPKDVEGIRPARLKRYFVAESEVFRAQPTLRRLVTFEEHSLVSDPPYHDLDLAVCRNVIIYFTPALQTQVLKDFHEGLKAGGFLLLGKAEVPVGETKGLFQCVDSKAKLYRK